MKKVAALTLVYLLIPTALFLVLWLKPIFAVGSILALAGAFWLAIRSIAVPADTQEQSSFDPRWIAASLAISLIFCIFSEFGILPYQSYDYLAHNAKLNMLSRQHLPLYDSSDEKYLCYYLGGYIVPSLLGSFTSIKLVRLFFFVSNWTGVALAFIWLQLLFRSHSIGTFCRFLFGLLIGTYVCVLFPFLDRVFHVGFVEGNSVNVGSHFVLNQIPAFTRGLSESPQHVIPAILAAACLTVTFQDRRFLFFNILSVAACAFLSPFVSLGMVPFVLFQWLQTFRFSERRDWVKLSLFVAITFAAFVPVLFYLAGSEATDMRSNQFIWQSDEPAWLLLYVLYLSGAYMIWLIFFRKLIPVERKMLIWIAIGAVSLLALVQVGHYNDLNIRAAMVPQLIFTFVLGHAVVKGLGQNMNRLLVIAGVLFWTVNIISPVHFYLERLDWDFRRNNSVESPYPRHFRGGFLDFMEQQYTANPQEVRKQYSLNSDSVFGRYLLRK